MTVTSTSQRFKGKPPGKAGLYSGATRYELKNVTRKVPERWAGAGAGYKGESPNDRRCQIPATRQPTPTPAGQWQVARRVKSRYQGPVSSRRRRSPHARHAREVPIPKDPVPVEE